MILKFALHRLALCHNQLKPPPASLMRAMTKLLSQLRAVVNFWLCFLQAVARTLCVSANFLQSNCDRVLNAHVGRHL